MKQPGSCSLAARLVAARDLANTFYQSLPCKMRVIDKALVFVCPDGAIALYPTHIEFLKLASSREGLETAITFLADRLAFQPRPLTLEPKENDVLAILPASFMASLKNLDPSELETLGAEGAVGADQIVSPDKSRQEDEPDSNSFDL